MVQVAQFIAALAAGLFAGAAIYINLAEHPARLSLSTEIAVATWRPSYKRATLVQVPLAVMSSLAAVLAWLLGGGSGWLIGGICIIFVVPFTLLVIKPTNNKLLAADLDFEAPETRLLLKRWGRLHAIRSLLSAIATVIFLVLLVWG
jgi:hypothetical protein